MKGRDRQRAREGGSQGGIENGERDTQRERGRREREEGLEVERPFPPPAPALMQFYGKDRGHESRSVPLNRQNSTPL